MTPDDAVPQQPEEDQPVIEPGLPETDDVSQPVAVGPGDPADRDPGHYDATPYAAGPVNGGAQAGSVAGTGTPAPAEDAGMPGTSGNGAAEALPVGWAGMTTPGDASLLDLVDRLTAVLERSDLAELEVASGGTTIILRSPAAAALPVVAAAGVTAGHAPAGDYATDGAPAHAAVPPAAPAPERPSVKAPLTGIYYAAPSPGATPYVAVGNHVSAGQIIGLIEAMKLFNEIKSDLSGRVVRICAESGALVKAKQPLIEVEPA
jgi:acetyl-CoA carboxylase biotin carboxyl carrier protein